MKNNQSKKKTVSLIDVMIQHADKGSSGFWTDDYEGCGNPKIFPEFEEGLRHGKYVHKEHFLCPWNTAVLYGDGHGNATALIKKYQNNEDIIALLLGHYGDDTVVSSEIGCLDFSPTGKLDVVGGEKLTYDDYIDIQIRSSGKQRIWFEMCCYNLPSEFMGCREKKTKKNICFKRIYASGMYPDCCDFFDGKEDHVWMDIQGFEDFKIGDCVSFFADIYKYIKTGNGKILDYSLRNPQGIKQIDSYQLPSDDDIIRQSINQILSETCYLSEHCNRANCLRNPEELQILREQMHALVK